MATLTVSDTKVADTQNSAQRLSSQMSTMKPSTLGKLGSWLGFTKSYNVPLFLIVGGAMLGFCLAKVASLDVGGVWSKQAAPGEWYWYQAGHYRIGITIHLCSVIPAGILMVWQFVPAIRHRFILFHRINGYTIIILVLLGNVGGLMIARRAFGGHLSTQAGVGILAIITTSGMALAYYNIRRLQIEQHRAWMLRTMVYLGTIITTRLILIIAAQILSRVGSYYEIMTCGELLSMRDAEYVATAYPLCAASNSSSIPVPVHVSFSNNIEEIGASLRIPFGMALWVAIFLHVVGVEIYLALTPREGQRLRMVSYERQLAAGFRNPGSAGLVVERLGDADHWAPDQISNNAKTAEATCRDSFEGDS